MSEPGQRALVVGIKSYQRLQKLEWAFNDALAMHEVLDHHENGEPNFECHLILGADPVDVAALADFDPEKVSVDASVNAVRRAMEHLFAFEGTVLLYYSGHGVVSTNGRCLAGQDSYPGMPGIPMNDVLRMANNSPARTVFLIIDSCYSGWMGNPPDTSTGNWDIPDTHLRDGVTILAAARPDEKAIEVAGQGVFTKLVLGALKGGGTDIRGLVSAASIYAYVEQALGPWQQRPVYKSNASSLPPIRFCRPDVNDDTLRLLPILFQTAEEEFEMDPSFESSSPFADPEHVKIFRTFKRYQVARLLRPSYAYDQDLYFVALRNHKVELTQLGRFYWQLAKTGRLSGLPAFDEPRSDAVIDPESLAKLFHETYERLAPIFQYETREATRTTWDKVPDNNKRLMVAVATEVLATMMELEKSAAKETASVPPAPPEA